MSLDDEQVGIGMLLVATTVFIYYSVWVFLVPFLDESHPLQSLFPAREWAVRIPALLLIGGVALIGTFIASVLYKGAQKKKAKMAAKKSS